MAQTQYGSFAYAALLILGGFAGYVQVGTVNMNLW
jgi:hypothetical protein